MTGRILSGYRHELVISSRFPGHVRAVIFSGILAGVLRVVFG